jgi:hypothetical protein
MNVAASNILKNRIENAIQVHREAGDLSCAEVIGVLDMIKLDIYMAVCRDKEEDEENYV